EKFLESKGTKFRSGGDDPEIPVAEASEDGKTFHLHIRVPEQDPIKRHCDDRIPLEDAKGDRYKPHSPGAPAWGKEHSIMYGYEKSKDPAVGPPAKVVVEDWTIVRHSIPFTFKDVPLP